MKDVKGTLIIGLDPGVTRFGAVAIDDQRGVPVAWATFHSAGKAHKKRATYHRVVSLSEQVVAWAKSITQGYRHVGIVIEKPIYNSNAKSFEIQWRLFQQVLTFLRHMTAPDWFLEVSNGTAKKCATGNGNASKTDMVCASHFDGPGYDREDQEALADAEAIANCWFVGSEDGRPMGAYSPLSKADSCHPGPVIQGGGDAKNS